MDGKMLLAIRAIEKRRNLFHKMLQQTRLPGISQGPWPLG
jgi:hypothetical protein